MNKARPSIPSEGPSSKQIKIFRRNGWIHIPGLLTKAEVRRFACSARHLLLEQIRSDQAAGNYRPIFVQSLNVWRRNSVLKALTLHPRIARFASALNGRELRLFHDNLLGKAPHSQSPTEWHQDQPFWPFADGAQGLTAWVALMDIPVQTGCMAFMSGQQHRRLPMQDVHDQQSLFLMAPDLATAPIEDCPMLAGDVTFHLGRTPHRAHANASAHLRMAHLIIYMDAMTFFDPAPDGQLLDHIVSRPLGLRSGDALDQELFPRVPLAES